MNGVRIIVDSMEMNPKSLDTTVKSDSESSRPSALSNQPRINLNESGCQAFRNVTALKL